MFPKEVTAMILSYVSNVKYFIQTNKLINTHKLMNIERFPLWFEEYREQIFKILKMRGLLCNNSNHFCSAIDTSTSVKLYIRTKTFSYLNKMVHDYVQLIIFEKEDINKFKFQGWFIDE